MIIILFIYCFFDFMFALKIIENYFSNVSTFQTVFSTLFSSTDNL